MFKVFVNVLFNAYIHLACLSYSTFQFQPTDFRPARTPEEEPAVTLCMLDSLLFLVRIKAAVNVCCLCGVVFLSLITAFI